MASLESIQSSWEVDSTLHLDRITEHSLEIAGLHNKYFKMLSEERIRLKSLENEFKQTKLIKYELFVYGPDERHHKLGWDIPRQRIIKGDLDHYFEGDVNLIEISNRVFIQKEKVDYLTSIIHIINKRSFDLKNAIAFERFKVGQ